jgi:hypothetical protein
MRSVLRGVVGIALGLFVSLALSGPAVAASTPDGCAEQPPGYAAPGVCQLTVEVATPVCVNDVPALNYQVLAEGTSATTVDITWLDPSGANVVYSNQPLSGSVRWPGAVVGADGKGVGWPGWIQQSSGAWVQGGPFSWANPSAQVLFSVGPQATVTVAYPAAAGCTPVRSDVLAAEPNVAAVAPQSGVLSETGANVEPLLLIAGGLVLVGAGALVTLGFLRRRHSA